MSVPCCSGGNNTQGKVCRSRYAAHIYGRMCKGRACKDSEKSYVALVHGVAPRSSGGQVQSCPGFCRSAAFPPAQIPSWEASIPRGTGGSSVESRMRRIYSRQTKLKVARARNGIRNTYCSQSHGERRPFFPWYRDQRSFLNSESKTSPDVRHVHIPISMKMYGRLESPSNFDFRLAYYVCTGHT